MGVLLGGTWDDQIMGRTEDHMVNAANRRVRGMENQKALKKKPEIIFRGPVEYNRKSHTVQLD